MNQYFRCFYTHTTFVVLLQNIGNCMSQQTVTSQKTWIFSSTAVGTSKHEKCSLQQCVYFVNRTTCLPPPGKSLVYDGIHARVLRHQRKCILQITLLSLLLFLIIY